MATIHWCRWDWCRASFPVYKDLVDHVLEQHVRTAKPVKRKDVAMLRKAEEGRSENAEDSIPTIPGFSATNSDAPPHAGLSMLTASTQDSADSIVDPGPSKSSPKRIVRTPPPAASPVYSPPPAASPEFTPLHGLSSERTPPKKRRRPTFSDITALSSPDHSPSMTSQPVSPAFDTLVANAVAPPSQNVHRPVQKLAQHSRSTSSSSSSRDVESQLTQGVRSSSSPTKPGSPLKQQVQRANERANVDELPVVEPPVRLPHPRTKHKPGASTARPASFTSGSVKVSPAPRVSAAGPAKFTSGSLKFTSSQQKPFPSMRPNPFVHSTVSRRPQAATPDAMDVDPPSRSAECSS
ncbi:hypothetical protein EVG20_g10625 [Dentipellis fragilis]|uniref:Uncharacterized protein n=1 Tax=Dentipellis fragilis TaxID=205917 RepID=A0A4Y9XUQ1_9AGAM|nr:hypothetical protein EVG20_g10625 [Dentipellis fragilis]